MKLAGVQMTIRAREAQIDILKTSLKVGEKPFTCSKPTNQHHTLGQYASLQEFKNVRLLTVMGMDAADVCC
jgi:hypothetical protein